MVAAKAAGLSFRTRYSPLVLQTKILREILSQSRRLQADPAEP